MKQIVCSKPASVLQQRLQERDAAKSAAKPAGAGAAPLATALSAKATQVQDLLTQLMQQQGANKEYLRWIQASVGNALRMISTKEILYFKSDEKYTLVQTAQAEYLIRKSLKELEDELDPQEFWRIHRSAIVSVSAIAEVSRDFRGRLMLSVKGHPEKLEVSRNHTHLFQQM
ncbi:LytR/AlgR family response regulator transcription factor [Undibacterium curvum]|uniref:LytR/AlgR family response regulator transcription factor n=1 Tax=Undibacterium curvum TaxID=2762294 RepID=UPI003D10B690